MSIQDRLRAAVSKLRTTSMPIADLVPLLQQAADELDNLTNEKAEYEKDEADMLMIAYMHGASSCRIVKE